MPSYGGANRRRACGNGFLKEDGFVRNVLIPIDGTQRSMKAVDLVKSLYTPESVRIVLLMVREDIENMDSETRLEKAKAELRPALETVAAGLAGYSVQKEIVIGQAGNEILECAEQNHTDIIVMTKSTKSGWDRKIGSVAAHVVKNANCIVMIVPENEAYEKTSRKAIRCNHPDDIVTLGGQLGLKPSSCFLPTQAGKCSYRITVLEGRLRFSHLSYNPGDGLWNLPPRHGQLQHYDLKLGEEREIELENSVDSGRCDRVEIVNPSMTSPLKFHYVIRFESVDA